MALTPEERRAKNQQNARKSTGPRSDQGKIRSRANALKHGLRAEAIGLPTEDPADVEARLRDWQDYYRPNSPAAMHLAQGILTYPREFAVNRLTWLADSIRPADDIGRFSACTGSGVPRAPRAAGCFSRA